MLLDRESPTILNTCAVVVAYQPDRQIIDRIMILLAQVNEVVIIDNNSNSVCREYLNQKIEQSENIHLILNDENLGIAAALNQGVKYALNQNYQWILTLDQDSIISSNFLEKMSIAYQECTYQNELASICPVLGLYDRDDLDDRNRVLQHRKCFQSDLAAVGTYTLTKTAITSGNLVKLEIFKTTGLFDENFFIDYVDHEFCLKIYKCGYKIIQSNDSLLYHQIGTPTEKVLFGHKIQVNNHNSLRKYYLTRNAILTYKRYFISDTIWVIKDIKILLSYIVKMILFEHDKIEKLRSILLGFLHGAIGKTGKYHERDRIVK
jgi:rhamnosyltransferase